MLQGYHDVVVSAAVDAINNHHSGAAAVSVVIGRSPFIQRCCPISITALSAGGLRADMLGPMNAAQRSGSTLPRQNIPKSSDWGENRGEMVPAEWGVNLGQSTPEIGLGMSCLGDDDESGCVAGRSMLRPLKGWGV